MTSPATLEPTAQNTLRARLVSPLANVRSLGRTTAATKDCRVGTSISTSASRQRNSRIATLKVGAKGTAIRNRLEGKCVRTIVFTSPMRRASHAAPRCETALRTCTAKNTKARLSSPIPKRLKNQYVTSASVRKPPPNASSENRAVSLATILLLSGAILVRAGTSQDGLATSTAGERKEYRVATARHSPK